MAGWTDATTPHRPQLPKLCEANVAREAVGGNRKAPFWHAAFQGDIDELEARARRCQGRPRLLSPQRREKRTAARSPNTTTIAALQMREPLM